MARPAIVPYFFQAQFLSHFLKILKLVDEEAILFLTLSSHIPLYNQAGTRVFGKGCESCIGQFQSVLLGYQHPEALRIAFKIDQVSPLILANMLLPNGPIGLEPEKIRDRLFSCMAKGRITNVMGQRCGCYNRTNSCCCDSFGAEFGIFFKQDLPCCFAKGATHRGYFQTVCQTGVDEGLFGKWENLGFILKIPKGR